jgi:hypothetical protein
MLQIKDREWVNPTQIVAIVLLLPGEENHMDGPNDVNRRRLYIDLIMGDTIKVYDLWIGSVMLSLALKNKEGAS